MQHIRAAALAVLTAIVLSACGGGGDAGSVPPPPSGPVAVPATVTVTAAAQAELGEPTKFTSSAASVAGLQHKWDFGDGATSDEAAPSHSYAKAGDYQVVLRVSNGAGESREVRKPLSVRAMANVAGLVCSGENQSGWCWQQPRPSGNATKNFFFVTSTVGWRVGEVGEIFRTADGGRNWVHQPSGTNTDLYEVQFVDDKRGAVLGNGQVLLTTGDGGATWVPGKLPVSTWEPGFRLLSNGTLYLPQTSTAYLSTDGGANWATVPKATAQSETGVFWYVNDATHQVSRSTDGGRTVTPVYDFKAEAVADGFVSRATQIVVRGDRTAVLRTRLARTVTYPEGIIVTVYKDVFHRTVDGGAAWSRIEAEDTLEEFTDLVAVSADGTRMLSNASARTSRISEDGGKTWATIPPHARTSIGYLAVATADATAIATTGDECWLTEDFGKTWTAITAPYPGYVTKLERVGTDMLIARQDPGRPMATVDKGRTWRQLLPGPSGTADSYPTDAAFLDAKTGFMLDQTGKLLATTDGGQTWAVRRSDLPLGGGSLHAIDAQTVMFRDKDGRLLRSGDRGMNWVTDTSNARYSRIEFGKAGLGWGVDTSDNLVATQDGGLTWTRVTRPVMGVLNDVHQVDANAWVAVGTDRTWAQSGSPWRREAIAYTRDGGKSWTAATFDASVAYGKDYQGNPVGLELFGVTASDAKTIWAVDAGGRILRSDDGGAQWTVAQQGGPGAYWLEDIAFIDAQRGWAVGSSGALMATTDGGKTWTRQDSNYKKTLTRIHIADSKTLWVSNAGGALLATATGGER